MSVWRAEADFTAIVALLPPPTTVITPGFYAACSYALAAVDRRTGGGHTVGIQAWQTHQQDAQFVGGNASNPAAYQSSYSFHSHLAFGTVTPTDPYYGGQNLSFSQTPGFIPLTEIVLADGGTAFGGGGILAMEWDDATDVFTFITPAGNAASTGTDLGFSALDRVDGIRPISVGILLDIQLNADDTAAAQSLSCHYHNFYGSKAGSHFTGAVVSTADPGFWADWANDPLKPSDNMVFTTTQLTPDYGAKLEWPGGPGVAASGIGYRWRPWLGGDMFGAPNIDDCLVLEHGLILAVWCPMASSLMLRVSYDHGHSWVDRVIMTSGTCLSNSVQWFNGQAIVVFYDGSQIQQTGSRDLGLTWSPLMPVSITGTNPRLVISPDGMYFYFYISGGNLVVSRSGDLGNSIFDAAPIVVASTVTAQDFGAVLAYDGSLVVSYVASSTWVSRRSRDLGLTWVTI